MCCDGTFQQESPVAWGSTCCCCGGVFESARARTARCRHGTSSVCCATTPALSPSIHQEEEEEGGAELRPPALVRTLGYTIPYGSPCANGSSSSPPPLSMHRQKDGKFSCAPRRADAYNNHVLHRGIDLSKLANKLETEAVL